ncbi:helix-turn-helix domain-containing protein [Nonomuraea sp. NPDC048892]|uniref:winged helix-turn-helix transcriptional regulator n=1 Tax=Nonomuraea sp. NPDC048892 TaxID=3154624 RepID=UPI0033DC9DAB
MVSCTSDQVFDPCPIAPTVRVIFGRWTTDVLWVLMHQGRMRFTDLRHRIPDVTPKVLSQRLRQLERDGLVTRSYYREMPPRVEYEATPLAHSLVSIYTMVDNWSKEHTHEVEAARAAYSGPLVS